MTRTEPIQLEIAGSPPPDMPPVWLVAMSGGGCGGFVAFVLGCACLWFWISKIFLAGH